MILLALIYLILLWCLYVALVKIGEHGDRVMSKFSTYHPPSTDFLNGIDNTENDNG